MPLKCGTVADQTEMGAAALDAQRRRAGSPHWPGGFVLQIEPARPLHTRTRGGARALAAVARKSGRRVATACAGGLLVAA